MGWMSVEENVLPGKALTPSTLLPVPWLALAIQGYMVSHQPAAPPETVDRLKMHPSGVQKQAAGEANGRVFWFRGIFASLVERGGKAG